MDFRKLAWKDEKPQDIDYEKIPEQRGGGAGEREPCPPGAGRRDVLDRMAVAVAGQDLVEPEHAVEQEADIGERGGIGAHRRATSKQSSGRIRAI